MFILLLIIGDSLLEVAESSSSSESDHSSSEFCYFVHYYNTCTLYMYGIVHNTK